MSMELNDPGAVGAPPGYRFTEDQDAGGPERALGIPSGSDVAYLQSIVNATAEANLPLREAVDVLYMDELSPDEDEGGTSLRATPGGDSAQGPYYAKTVRLSVVALDAVRRGRGGKYARDLAEQARDSSAFEAGRVLSAIATQAAAVHCPVPVTEVSPDSPLRDIMAAARGLRETGYGGPLELLLIGGLEGFETPDLNYLQYFKMVFPGGVRPLPQTPHTELSFQGLRVLGAVFDPSARGIRLDIGANLQLAWMGFGKGTHTFSLVTAARATVVVPGSIRLLVGPPKPKASPSES